MKISIIGTGKMGKALVKTLSAYLPDVYWSGRSPEKVERLISEMQLPVKALSTEEALASDVLIPTLSFRDLPAWININRKKLKGKIWIDITNPFNDTFDDFTLDYGKSAAEEIQRILPDMFVVGAFKNTFCEVFNQPICNDIKSDVYLTSDHAEAKQLIMELFSGLPFRVFDGGALKNNRTIERMTLLSQELAQKTGTYPYTSFHLWGVREKEEHRGVEAVEN